MAQRNNFDAVLPATRCEKQMRDDVAAVAEAAKVDMADVIRDALASALPAMMLSLGIITIKELDDEALAALGVKRDPEPKKEDRSAGLFGGPPRVG